jgi:hypothetical protein
MPVSWTVVLVHLCRPAPLRWAAALTYGYVQRQQQQQFSLRGGAAGYVHSTAIRVRDVPTVYSSLPFPSLGPTRTVAGTAALSLSLCGSSSDGPRAEPTSRAHLGGMGCERPGGRGSVGLVTGRKKPVYLASGSWTHTHFFRLQRPCVCGGASAAAGRGQRAQRRAEARVRDDEPAPATPAGGHLRPSVARRRP